MRQLFLDLDGVMADFDGHYLSQFGESLDRAREHEIENPNGMFEKINQHGSFFADLPMIDGAAGFYSACVTGLHKTPIVITGTPNSVRGAAMHKREWVSKHIDKDVFVICCKSSEKYMYCSPGDVLIDDWAKHRARWEAAGGIFILHKNFRDSYLQAYGLFNLDY